MKVLFAVLTIMVIILSVPKWRRRYLGKYAALVLACAWIAAMVAVLLL